MASQYHWSENDIWWNIPFHRLVLYVDRINRRKMAEAGGKQVQDVQADVLDLLDIVEQVKKDKGYSG